MRVYVPVFFSFHMGHVTGLPVLNRLMEPGFLLKVNADGRGRVWDHHAVVGLGQKNLVH